MILSLFFGKIWQISREIETVGQLCFMQMTVSGYWQMNFQNFSETLIEKLKLFPCTIFSHWFDQNFVAFRELKLTSQISLWQNKCLFVSSYVGSSAFWSAVCLCVMFASILLLLSWVNIYTHTHKHTPFCVPLQTSKGRTNISPRAQIRPYSCETIFKQAEPMVVFKEVHLVIL